MASLDEFKFQALGDCNSKKKGLILARLISADRLPKCLFIESPRKKAPDDTEAFGL
jgi:hypothetical protein